MALQLLLCSNNRLDGTAATTMQQQPTGWHCSYYYAATTDWMAMQLLLCSNNRLDDTAATTIADIYIPVKQFFHILKPYPGFLSQITNSKTLLPVQHFIYTKRCCKKLCQQRQMKTSNTPQLSTIMWNSLMVDHIYGCPEVNLHKPCRLPTHQGTLRGMVHTT